MTADFIQPGAQAPGFFFAVGFRGVIPAAGEAGEPGSRDVPIGTFARSRIGLRPSGMTNAGWEGRDGAPLNPRPDVPDRDGEDGLPINDITIRDDPAL
jgi:hypothetical protein